MQTLGKFGEKYGKIYAIDFLGYRCVNSFDLRIQTRVEDLLILKTKRFAPHFRKIIVSDIDLMRRMMKDPAFTGRPHVSTLSDMYSDGVGHGGSNLVSLFCSNLTKLF